MKAHAWFLDGTFKTASNIFYRLFAILGSVIQMHQGKEQIVALPFVYALLESKEEFAYPLILSVMSYVKIFSLRLIISGFDYWWGNLDDTRIDKIRECLHPNAPQ